MSRKLLFLVALVALASARQYEVPDSLFSKNYDRFKEFVQGFMTGYEGKTYDLPDDCLSPASQSKIDQDLVAIFASLARFKPEVAFTNLKTFLTDMRNTAETCGLTEVKRSLDIAIEEKGAYSFLLNFLWGFFDLEADFFDSIGNLIEGKFEEGGLRLGNAVAVIVPPAPLNLLIDLFESNGILNFAKGLIIGLEEDPTKPSKCGTDLSSMADVGERLFADAGTFIKDANLANLTVLLADLTKIVSDMRDYSTDCNFSTLIQSLEKLFTREGPNILISRYLANAKTIRTDLDTVKVCSTDYTACGTGIGEIFRIMVGWKIQTVLGYEVEEDSSDNAIDFLKGFVSGLTATPGDACTTDLSSLDSDISGILTDIQKLAKGDILVVRGLISKLNDLISKVKSFSGDCNFAGLGEIIANAFTAAGAKQIVTNFLTNMSVIVSDVGDLKNCSENYTTCGQDVGEPLRLLLGWGL